MIGAMQEDLFAPLPMGFCEFAIFFIYKFTAFVSLSDSKGGVTLARPTLAPDQFLLESPFR